MPSTKDIGHQSCQAQPSKSMIHLIFTVVTPSPRRYPYQLMESKCSKQDLVKGYPLPGLTWIWTSTFTLGFMGGDSKLNSKSINLETRAVLMIICHKKHQPCTVPHDFPKVTKVLLSAASLSRQFPGGTGCKHESVPFTRANLVQM
jgi:hypothetical protein